MEAHILIALCLVTVIQGMPVQENETATLEKQQDVSGYFIPVDTWQNFQNQLQPKTNQPQPTINDPNIIILPSQPTNVDPISPPASGNGQINAEEIYPPKTNSPTTLNPDSKNQPIILQPGQYVINQDQNGRQTVLIPGSNVQGNQQNQPIILVQQPSQNNPVVLPQQPNQPLYIQPGQSYILQNGQNGKPTQVMVAVPSNNQGAYVQPGPNQGAVYTLVLNNQSSNSNPNGNLYLVPVQSGSTNPIILRAAQ